MDELKIRHLIDVEPVLRDSANDYLTVIAIAKKARRILDEYGEYEELVAKYKPTTIALSEFLEGRFRPTRPGEETNDNP